MIIVGNLNLRLKNSRSDFAEFGSGKSDFQLTAERLSCWIDQAPMIRFQCINNRKWSNDWREDLSITKPRSDHWNTKNYQDQRCTSSVSV